MQLSKSEITLSVALISFNEEKNIGRTLESIQSIASEIILIDSFSKDRTKEIAESFGAAVYKEDFHGHIAQKNIAISKCTNEWILTLDCDEVATPELINSIKEAIISKRADGFEINRKTYYLGKLLHYAWQPDWNLRLVKKSSSPVWKGLDPHDILKIEGKTGKLSGDLIHYSYSGLYNHFNKTIGYASTSAKSNLKFGRKFKLTNLLFNPIIAFFRLYVVRKGFLDGVRGLFAGFSTFVYTFLKYAFLWELEHKDNNEN